VRYICANRSASTQSRASALQSISGGVLAAGNSRQRRDILLQTSRGHRKKSSAAGPRASGRGIMGGL